MKNSWSIEEQQVLFRKLGLDPSRYDPDDPKIVAEFGHAALTAQLSAQDARGNWLSEDEYRLVVTITGRDA